MTTKNEKSRVDSKAGSQDSPTASQNKLIQPLPWTPEMSGEFYNVIDPNGFCVFGGVTSDEAELICRAVNGHAELLAALKATERLCQQLCTVALNPKIADYLPFGLIDEVTAHLKSCDVIDALAHAEGR